jgi:oxygen-dependent protoporphyrinogen oxidase
MRRIAIIGGGISGLAAAYELARLAEAGAPVEAVLFESSGRFGGVIETVREGGFTVETGPDAWVSAKPWARELAVELGLEAELTPSNDASRKTYIFLATPQNPSGALLAMPEGFHMMVPSNLDVLDHSPLFSREAIAAYRAEPARAAELLASIPSGDESVADFTRRHFGPEVLARVAAPLLSGVFGGDVRTLSVRAVMPAFVQMEREHGSLITALQAKPASRPASGNLPPASVFTTLRTGLGTLVDRIVAAIPEHWLRLHTTVTSVQVANADSTNARRWMVDTSGAGKRTASECFDAVMLATPLQVTRRLLAPLDPAAGNLLPSESSSAVLVAFAYADASRLPVPPGFGFLVPPELSPSNDSAESSRSLLLACTFADQKFPHRVPPNGRLVRAFFGGAAADRIARCNNDEIAAIARLELARILNANAPITGPAPSPAPVPVVTLVRRWPSSLPQYAVGHPGRIAELESRLAALPGLTLLGNALHGVGIPDLIRASRQASRQASTQAARAVASTTQSTHPPDRPA